MELSFISAGRTPHLQFKRERYSRVVNEKLVAVFLDAEALAGDFGTVDGHQVRDS